MTKERPNEPSIFINGVKLFEGQAMTMRVALETFISYLKDEGLGEDELGKAMVKGYLARIDEIRTLMYFKREEE